MSNVHSSTRQLQPVSPSVCELLPSLSDAAPSPATTAGTVRRRYYNDRQNYRLLDEYAVADGCSESEVMQQISCDVNGDFVFNDVFDTSDASRQPISYAAPYPSPLKPLRCLNHNAVVFFSRASSPPSISWLNPPVPVVDGEAVVEKTVFGMLRDTRQLWVQLLCGTALPHPAPATSLVALAISLAPAPASDASTFNNDVLASSKPNAGSSAPVDEVEDREAISADEAQSFISNVLQRCINLMDIRNERDLMTHALGCVDAWLQVL